HVIGDDQRERNPGQPERPDIDRIIQAEQRQQQIRARVGPEKEGKRSEVERILQTLRDNDQPQSGIGHRMEPAANQFGRQTRQDPRDKLSGDERAELHEAAKLQSKLEERTGQLFGQMQRVAKEKGSQAQQKERSAEDNIQLAQKQAGQDKDLAAKLADAAKSL